MGGDMSRAAEEFGLIRIPAGMERLGLIPTELSVLLQWRAPTAAHTARWWASRLPGMSSQRVT